MIAGNQYRGKRARLQRLSAASRPAQRGIALAIVVWFVAGMSLLVAGIVSHARVDSRLTGVHLARAEVVAAGDGAIMLAMAERRRGYQSSGAGPMISETVHRVGDIEVTVRLVPANGFERASAFQSLHGIRLVKSTHPPEPSDRTHTDRLW